VSAMHRMAVRLLALVVLSMMGGCAALGPVSSSQVASSTGPTTSRSDPWERFNRAMFGFNEVVDAAVIKPVALAYREVVPRIVRTGIDNVFGNLSDLWSAANLLLQLKPQPALEMGMRVATNTVFGLGGLLDVAEEAGLERRSYEDFGQTLGRWGISSGPYLVLPLLGPSTVRDGASRVVDNRFSPGRIALREQRDRNTAIGLQLLSARVGLLNASRLLDDIALDKYVFVRDAYLARRRSQIYDGEPPEEDAPAAPASPSK